MINEEKLDLLNENLKKINNKLKADIDEEKYEGDIIDLYLLDENNNSNNILISYHIDNDDFCNYSTSSEIKENLLEQYKNEFKNNCKKLFYNPNNNKEKAIKIILEEFEPYQNVLSNYTNNIINLLENIPLKDNNFKYFKLEDLIEILKENDIDINFIDTKKLLNNLLDINNEKSIIRYREDILFEKLKHLNGDIILELIPSNSNGTYVDLYSESIVLDDCYEVGFFKNIINYNQIYNNLQNYIEEIINISFQENGGKILNDIIKKEIKYDDVIDKISLKKYIKIKEILINRTLEGEIIINQKSLEQLEIISEHYKENQINYKNIIANYIKNNLNLLIK